MLDVSGVNQYYGESHILRDVELSVPSGSCVCLMGRNGVGKTTLLKSIMGLLKLRSGKIRSDSVDVLIRLNGQEKLTLLVVEQKLVFARRVGTHYAIMDRGRLVASGVMSELTDALVHRHLVV